VGTNRAEEAKMKGKSTRRVKLPNAEGQPVSWRNVTPGVLADVLTTVAIAGGALRLGYTRDGGAYAVGVYGDGDPYTLYCSPHESIDDLLRAIRDGFTVQGH